MFISVNTYKTVLGYLKSLLPKFPFANSQAKALEDIYNYLRINNTITTSGQPTEEQFRMIKESGFDQVINLAPHSADNALDDEPGTLSSLGIRYTHIPVDFENPTDENFAEFVEELTRQSKQKVWVHCAANMRVSAFIYRYRCEVLGEDKRLARHALNAIWEPFGVWKLFISRQ